ncbi:MAG: hypothetical protein RLZZ414_1897 [Bacteroidota bacterium]|jgi:predicted Zn-dependent protease
MNWKHVTIIVFALALVVVLYILPTPNSKYRTVEYNSNKETVSGNTSVSEKITSALKIIQGGGAPMEGIQLLLDVLNEDPNNVEALYYLGDFSLKTGQFEKAISRFETLVKVQPENSKFWFLLAQAYELNKDKANAVIAYKNCILYTKDEARIKEIEQKIIELK